MLYVHLLSVLPVVINTGMSIWSLDLEMFGCLRSSALALAHGARDWPACLCLSRSAPRTSAAVSAIAYPCRLFGLLSGSSRSSAM